MKALLPIAIVAAAMSVVPDSLGPIGRKSNSEASSQRGREAFAEGRYEDAVREFGTAAEIRPGPATSFNLGTARVAAGDLQRGLQSLTDAYQDETLATDVRYNAGWAALEGGALDDAIREYEEVLRSRPGDGNAKRNLEIALRRKQEQQQQQSQQGGQQNPPQPQPQPQKPGEDEQQGGEEPPQADQPQPGASDLESILRSVEQQEKEELERMRRTRRGRKVDW